MPVVRTASAVIALTVPAVPTAMNAGVSSGPWAVCRTPARALPVGRQGLKAERCGMRRSRPWGCRKAGWPLSGKVKSAARCPS